MRALTGADDNQKCALTRRSGDQGPTNTFAGAASFVIFSTSALIISAVIITIAGSSHANSCSKGRWNNGSSGDDSGVGRGAVGNGLTRPFTTVGTDLHTTVPSMFSQAKPNAEPQAVNLCRPKP